MTRAAPRRAMVLAAGFGKRLRPLTELLPKPLVPVANRPLITYQLGLLRRAGVEWVAVNLHHRGELIPPALAAGAGLGLDIHYSRESTILGTGGGLYRLREQLAGGTFYLLNGDVLCDVDLLEVLDFHRRLGAVATMVVRPLPAERDFTPLELDESGRLVRFKDAALRPRGRVQRVMFCGLHVLEPAVFDFLPGPGFSCINDQAYRAMLRQGLTVAGYLYRGPWFDLGTPADYLRANLELAAGRFRPGQLPEPPGWNREAAQILGAGVSVAAGARLGAEVVAGDGAAVEAGARVERAVLWPGSRVEAGRHLHGAIVAGPHLLAGLL